MHCPKFKFGTDDVIYRRDGADPIPDDEPVFLIRGKDEIGLFAILRYIEVAEMYPESQLAQEHAESAQKMLETIAIWQANNPERVGMGCHTCEHLDHRVRLDFARVPGAQEHAL